MDESDPNCSIKFKFKTGSNPNTLSLLRYGGAKIAPLKKADKKP